MDCCKYGEYRAHGQYGAGAPWEGYGSYAPLPYAPYGPYAHHYHTVHAHDPYARYYRYDYPTHHVHHTEHAMPMDYGTYASKETRVRRPVARRDQRSHTSAHLPLPSTPPLECGVNGRSPAYCEPSMWPHYQMGVMGGGGGGGRWSGSNVINGGWAPRSTCSRDSMRYSSECRSMKATPMHGQNHTSQDGRSTPYSAYEDTPFHADNSARQRNTPDYKPSVAQLELSRTSRARLDRGPVQPRRSPPEEKISVPVVPLPAFQQAFGSTEIGKFAEAFSRTEVPIEDAPTDSFMYESYPDWENSGEPQWSTPPASREIKCEDNF